jgi:hypothetical protein
VHRCINILAQGYTFRHRISASIHLPLIGDAERMGLKSQKRSYFEQAMCGVMCCANNWIKYNIYSPERIWKNAKAVCIIPTVQLSPVRMGLLGKPPAEPSTSAPSILYHRTEFRVVSLPGNGSERNSERVSCTAEQPEFRWNKHIVPSIPSSEECWERNQELK